MTGAMGQRGTAMEMTTVRGTSKGRCGPPRPAVGLTLAYHPDASRIGELAALVAGPNAVSRTEPRFAQPGAELAPLASPFISRRPFVIEVGDTIRLVPANSGDRLQLERVPLSEPTVVPREELAAGLVIEAGGLVFVLHELVSDDDMPSMGMVGESTAMRRLRCQIGRAAGHDIPVLVRGETGVGKELVARALHRRSPRAEAPFVSVNLAAIPPATAASALFGHKRGAFTGADRDHHGYFGEASGGTLFLDEIGETPEDIQSALLRALETGEIQPVGAPSPVTVDVRIVAATDLELESALDEGRFRLPLLMRLSGYEITVPPLRARRDDVPRLLMAFIRAALPSDSDLLAPPELGDESWLSRKAVLTALRARWSGNIRQLRHAARQLVVDNLDQPYTMRLAGLEREAAAERNSAATVTASGAPPTVASPAPIGPALESIAGETLRAALEAHGYRPSAAARALGLSKTSIYELMRRHEIPTSADLDVAVIRTAIEEASGDLACAARLLHISTRALKLRMRTLAIS